MSGMLSAVSLFAGGGGMDIGLSGGFTFLDKFYEQLPVRVVWANELDRRAADTLELNFPDTEVVCGDIVQIVNDADSLNKIPKVDIVVGGFPCQDFSLAGKRQGLSVQRGKLYLSMAKVIEHARPKVFIAENVKGLLTWQGGLGIRTMVSDFEALGYTVEHRLLNAADYGVPQKRQRVIIIGVRKDLNRVIEWPERTHTGDLAAEPHLLPWVSIKDAIGDLEDDEVRLALPNPDYSKAKRNKGQGNTTTVAGQPAPTMRAEHHGNIEFHYSLDRRLSAREAARIQSFPDEHVFAKTTTDAYRQVGNAIAPVFGWHITRAVVSSLNK